MNSTYELVRYEPRLKNEVIELQTHLWSRSLTLNTSYFEWKYERNPYISVPLIYLAMYQGKAVGMRGFFGTQWESSSPTHRTILLSAEDMVIHPTHRNRGLMTMIMATAFEDLAQREYRYAINLSAGPITILSSLTTGWRKVGSMQPMLRRSRQVTARARLKRILTRLPGIGTMIHKLTAKRPPETHPQLPDPQSSRVKHLLSKYPYTLFDEKPHCAEMAELVTRIGSDGRLRHVRDQNYLEWRYQNPLRRYRFLFCRKTCLEGYLVLQEYTSSFANTKVVNIVDWEMSRAEAGAQLLKAAIDVATGRPLVIWSACLSEEKRYLLVRSGFEPEQEAGSAVEQKRILLVRPIGNGSSAGNWLLDGRPMLEMKSWDLRMLDSTIA